MNLAGFKYAITANHFLPCHPLPWISNTRLQSEAGFESKKHDQQHVGIQKPRLVCCRVGESRPGKGLLYTWRAEKKRIRHLPHAANNTTLRYEIPRTYATLLWEQNAALNGNMKPLNTTIPRKSVHCKNVREPATAMTSGQCVGENTWEAMPRVFAA